MAGEGTCRLYRIEAGNVLKQVPSALSKRESPPQSYTAHAWLVDNDTTDTMVVGTASGEVLIVHEGDIRQALQLESEGGVASLAASSRVSGPGMQWDQAGRELLLALMLGGGRMCGCAGAGAGSCDVRCVGVSSCSWGWGGWPSPASC